LYTLQPPPAGISKLR